MASTLTPQDWQQLQEIFVVAAELPPDARALYLETACAGKPAIRQQADAMVAVMDSTTHIGSIVGSVTLDSFLSRQPIVGEQLGAYRIEGILGRGGMSVVYRAVRADDSYHQVVAIKVAAVDQIDASLHRRFLDERQILATLDHPHIAHLLDGGTTPTAIPYVVMEYVDGLPIHVWCRKQELSIGQRIELVIEVARAVDYAHRHLVIHRDLKPENIYVNQEGSPKLLDFGIAKVLDPGRSGFRDAVTLDADRMMTPDYASPEQVQGNPVTTATDIYQLGAVLYVLLTGKPMFVRTTTGFGELERAICEQPVPKTQLDTDLDLILHKALEKEPLRRYATAADFANDLQRYLNREPIEARPDSWFYRTSKFVRRNPASTFAATGLVVLILVFGIVAGSLARRYRNERNNVETQRNIAQAHLHQARLESDLLKKIFLVGDPVNSADKKLSRVEFLDRDYDSVENLLDSDPEVRIDMLDTLAKAYADIQRPDRAEKLLREDVELNSKLYGAESPDVRDHLIRLADTLASENKVKESEQLRFQIVEIAKREQGINSGRAINLSYRLYVSETDNLPDDSQLQERERSVLASLKRDLADTGSADTRYGHLLEDYGRLGEIYRTKGDLARAMESLQHVTHTVDHENPHPKSDFAKAREYDADPLMRMSEMALEEGNFVLGEQLARDSLGIIRKLPANGLSPYVVDALALNLANQGKYDEARGLYRQEDHDKSLIPRRRLVFLCKVSEASAEERAGNLANAQHLLLEGLSIQEHIHGRDNMRYVSGELQLAVVLTKEHQLQAAEKALKHSAAVLESLHQPSPLMEGDLYADRAALEIAQGHWSAAASDAASAREVFERRIPLAHPRIANALNLQATVLEHQHQNAEAQALRKQAAALGSSFVSGIEWIT